LEDAVREFERQKADEIAKLKGRIKEIRAKKPRVRKERRLKAKKAGR
jgi:hypothetical protein